LETTWVLERVGDDVAAQESELAGLHGYYYGSVSYLDTGKWRFHAEI
jgi:hypothetical protein